MIVNNLIWHDSAVSLQEREVRNGHKSCVLWYTGLSGSGKSTIANSVDRSLFDRGCKTFVLDGDNVRHGLNGDLSFSNTDRVENIRRIAEVSKLFADGGNIVSTALISPFNADRQLAKRLIGLRFIEIFISTPLEVCEQRDPKGLYKKARKGEITHFTGIDSAYEQPEHPNVIIDSSKQNVQESTDQIINYLCKLNIIK